MFVAESPAAGLDETEVPGGDAVSADGTGPGVVKLSEVPGRRLLLEEDAARRKAGRKGHHVHHARIFCRRHDQPAKNKPRILTCRYHFCQIVQGSIRVRTTNGLDERTNGIVMFITGFVILHRASLNGFFSDLQGNMPDAKFVRMGGFHSKFKCIQRGTNIPIGQIRQVI